jgi:hypothetical protein
MWRKAKAIAIGTFVVLAALALALFDAFVRGKKSGAAKQEGKDRKESIDEAVKKDDTAAIDKEWER